MIVERFFFVGFVVAAAKARKKEKKMSQKVKIWFYFLL